MPPPFVPPGDHARTMISSADRTRQPYRLYVPDTAPPPGGFPLAVVLHGKDVDHNAWFDHTPVAELAEQAGYLIAAPAGRGPRIYEGPGEQDVLDVIQDVRSACPVDDDRVHLTGHSMGGWGTWYIAARHPDRFATICTMAGPVPTELLPRVRYVDPFIIHDADDDVIAVTESREAAWRLAELGISHRYREERGFGHSSRLIGANLPRIFAWFDQHRRPGS